LLPLLLFAEALDIDDFFAWAKKSQHSAAMMDKLNRVAAVLQVRWLLVMVAVWLFCFNFSCA
jgi:hypothetical protein